ncbi:YbjN domain-containing protein, partial [Bacillus sp. SIMBA_069]
GIHKRLFSPASKDEILLLINEWHRDRPWPKAFATVDDVGDLRIQASHSYDLEHGVTDEQLAQFLDCSLSTILQFFQYMDAAVTST